MSHVTRKIKKWLKMMMMFAGTYKYWTAGSESISCGVRRNYLTSIRFRMTGLPYAFTTQWMKPRASGR